MVFYRGGHREHMFASDISDYWRLCESFTVRQAAFLIVGVDPDSEIATHCEGWKPHERPAGYGAAKQAISSGLSNGYIKGEHFQLIDTDWNGNAVGEKEGTTDLDRSVVERNSVSDWLVSRGITTGFFFPYISTEAPDFLDRNNPRYAPKLAAAVQAWLSVTDPKGKSPKQALMKWLRENAAEFGLSDDEGKPNETGIEEVAKVANWMPGGGSAKTP